MKLISLFLIILFASCSQLKLKLDDKTFDQAKFLKKEKYIEVQGAGDVLRAVSAATIMVKFRQVGDQSKMQDLIAISIGSALPTASSRASIRLSPGGYLAGIARAKDSDEGQNVSSSAKAKSGQFHTAALVINYEQNQMFLYLDGSPVETKGTVKFGAPMTSDTASANIALGAEDNGSDLFFEGEIRDPRVWRRGLTPEEILSLSK